MSAAPLTDLAALEAAHDALWHTLRGGVPGPAALTAREAADAQIRLLMQPVLAAQALWQRLGALGYAPVHVAAVPYRDSAGLWCVSGMLQGQCGNVVLTLRPPQGGRRTLGGALDAPWTLHDTAHAGHVEGGRGLRARMLTHAQQAATQLRDEDLLAQIRTVICATARRQHPHTNSEGVNHRADGRQIIERRFPTASLLTASELRAP